MKTRKILLASILVVTPNSLFAFQGQGNPNPGGGAGGGAGCEVSSLTVVGGSIATDYDPTEAADMEVEFTIDVVSTGCGSQNIPLSIDADPTDPDAVSGNTINLEASDGSKLSARISSKQRSSSNGALVVDPKRDGTTSSGPFYLVLTSGQRVAPGTYSASLQAAVTPNQGGAKTGRIAAPFQVIVNVRPLIGLAAGSGTELDLGQISAGGKAMSPVSFHAYANINYTLKFTSDYEFRMRKNSQNADPSIPYVLLFNNQVLSANGSQVQFTVPGQQVSAPIAWTFRCRRSRCGRRAPTATISL
jgi:hypothetical protein